MTGGRKRILEGHSDWVSSVAFSPGGFTLASGSSDGTVLLWEFDSTVNIAATAKFYSYFGAVSPVLGAHFTIALSVDAKLKRVTGYQATLQFDSCRCALRLEAPMQ